jgi:hypothetical protein
MMPPSGPPGPDPWDDDLAVIHNAADNLGPRLAIWQARREPDAFARRAANDALDAIDAAIDALHRIRARLVTDTRRADDETAVRVDELLARTRGGGPPGRETGDGPLPEGTASTPPGHHHAPEAAGMRITRGVTRAGRRAIPLGPPRSRRRRE